ncbi:PAS domain S-box protein [Belnapia sp. T6]|uniref:histidine kinase n=1 Tax=Belnapia mucosa TaxID=2804532 RepID=A0ABS1V674_9PROT|nr:PAS domain S-box protein [Belnapia mucosa]MBL6456214.1 PAS domain S-box protein [Belnapia mucosa]
MTADDPAPVTPVLGTEDLFRALGDNAYSLDRAFRFTDFNTGCASYYGRPPEEVLGRAIWEVFPQALDSPLERLLRGVMDQRRPLRTEIAGVVRPHRWVEVTVFPTAEGLGVVFRDRTAEHRAEEALRASEERLRDLLATLNLGTAMTRDMDGIIRFWSEGCSLLYGWTAAEALGQPAHALLRTVFPLPLAEIEAVLEQDGEWTGDLHQQARDGRRLVVAVRKVLRRGEDGRPVAVLEGLADVTAQRTTEAALAESEARLRLAISAARLGSWEIDLRRRVVRRSGQTVPARQDLPLLDCPLDQLVTLLHPEDRAQVEASIAAVAEGRADSYRIEYRSQARDGGYRWIESHGVAADPDPATGLPLRLVGVSSDVTERKQAEERQRLLMREVDHRAKNALAVVQAALRLTARDDPTAYMRAVEGRVAALARAQTLLARGQWSGAALRTLLEEELAPFLAEGQGAPRVRLDGPPVLLWPAGAQALAMAVHELATNAVKHGALGQPGGEVAVRWQVEPPGRLLLDWAERGGPPVSGSPARRGFGTRVLDGTIGTQLGGRITRDWSEAGVMVSMTIPLQHNPRADNADAAAVLS